MNGDEQRQETGTLTNRQRRPSTREERRPALRRGWVVGLGDNDRRGCHRERIRLDPHPLTAPRHVLESPSQ